MEGGTAGSLRLQTVCDEGTNRRPVLAPCSPDVGYAGDRGKISKSVIALHIAEGRKRLFVSDAFRGRQASRCPLSPLDDEEIPEPLLSGQAQGI